MEPVLSTNHGKEDAKLEAHLNVVSVGEDEVLLPLLLTGEYDGDLLGRHRQYWQVYTVELIKASPRS